MAIWTVLVVLTAPWALGLVGSVGGLINLVVVSAIIVMATQLGALLLVTIQRTRLRGHAA